MPFKKNVKNKCFFRQTETENTLKQITIRPEEKRANDG
jgi:hypothetical protein